MRMKYIVLDKKHMVLFPMELIHKNVAEGCRRACGRDHRWMEVTSAGFVDMAGGFGSCYGNSESLGIGSVSEDQRLLTETYGLKPPLEKP